MLKINFIKKSDLYLIKAKLIALKNKLLKVIYSQQKKYQQIEEILKLLNSPNLQNEDQKKIKEILESPLLASEEELKNYLSKQEYIYIDLKNIKEKEKQILEKLGINLEYLKMNTKITTQSGVLSEVELSEIEKIAYKNLLRFQKCQLNSNVASPIIFTVDDQSIAKKRIQIENDYIYATCPISGRIIASNCSFVVSDSCFYRFVGEKVFYLFTYTFHELQHFMYIPEEDIIIQILPLDLWILRDVTKKFLADVIINPYKLYNIKFRKEVFKYITTGNKQKILLFHNLDRSIGHYLINDISALDTFKNSIVKSNAKILVKKPMYFGKIEELFPEIEAQIELIDCLQDPEQRFETMLKNNYYIIIVAQRAYVTENLALKIQIHSRKKCSEEFLNNLQEIRNKHFPLMMVQLRSGRRKWLSQIEGVINIINTLGKAYPNLGVVFDGYSRVPFEEDDEETIKAINKEKEIVQRIRESLTVNVPIYDTCGSLIFESIMWASIIDFYLGQGGSSGSAKTVWIANKPGVTHEPAMLNLPKEQRPYWAEWTSVLWRENGKMPLCVSKEFITDYPTKQFKLFQTDYDFDWRIAHKEIIRLISLLPKNG